MRYRWTIPIIALVVGLTLLVPALAVAQSDANAGATTMQSALEQALTAEGGTGDALDELVRSGAEFERALVAEVTPDNRGVVAELEFSYEGRTFRFPVKLERTEPKASARWTVSWMPEPAYARALIGAIQAGPLPSADIGDPWTEQTRLPALPVIIRSDAVFTPFGRGALVDEARAPKDQALTPPAAVVKAAQRWVGGVLSEDPAPAGVDLLVDPAASWKDLSRVVMGVSSSGLFRIHLIRQGPRQLLTLPAAAPVFDTGARADGAAPLVVAMFPHDDGFAFRIRIGDQEHRPDDPCRPGASFCADSPRTYEASLAKTVEDLASKSDTTISYVMFAAGSETTAGDGLSYFARTHSALGIDVGKVFLGYVSDDHAEAKAEEAP